MAQIYLGRVRGAGMYTTTQQSTNEKTLAVQKTLVSPTTFSPAIGDTVIFANGDAREVVAVDDLFVTCGETKANFKGEKGDPPAHYWQGSILTVTSSSGTSSADLKGERGNDGVGVLQIEQTKTSNADGGQNELTVTLSDGTKSVFFVKNGSAGKAPAFQINKYGELVATFDEGV